MKDKRDLRDPEKLGNALLEVRVNQAKNTLSQVYDSAPGLVDTISDYEDLLDPRDRYGDPRDIPTTGGNALDVSDE